MRHSNPAVHDLYLMLCIVETLYTEFWLNEKFNPALYLFLLFTEFSYEPYSSERYERRACIVDWRQYAKVST